MAVPEPMATADVELSIAVSIPTTVAKRWQVACMPRDVLGCDDGKNLAVTSCAERKKRRKHGRLQNKRDEIGRSLGKDARKDTNERAVAGRLIVLVGVVGIR